MSRNWLPWALAGVLLLGLIFTSVLAARGPRPVPTPTIDSAPIETRAVATFAGGLTSTAVAQPTSTATETPLPPTEAAASAESTSSVSATPSCYRLKYDRDVTIPDGTIMTPAEVFTKTWQVENSGTCPWKPGFKLVLVGGAAMGAAPFTIEATVNPGGRMEISVKMVAPTNQTGIIQGTWRMQDDTGAPFGDALTIVIVIGNTTTALPTLAASPTP